MERFFGITNFYTSSPNGFGWNKELDFDSKYELVDEYVCTDNTGNYRKDILHINYDGKKIGSFHVLMDEKAVRDDMIMIVCERLDECHETLAKQKGISERDCYVKPPYSNFRHACEEWMRIWGDAVLIDDFNKARPELECIATYLETHCGTDHIEKDGYTVFFDPNGWPLVQGDSYDGTKQSIGGDAMFYERHNPTPYPDEWKE